MDNKNMKNIRNKKNNDLLILGVLLAVAGSATAYPIAGTAPDQRPEGAPVVADFPKNADWYNSALRGVDRPYPKSLQFLEDQGAWYTPFTRPGMTGRYDIRHWH